MYVYIHIVLTQSLKHHRFSVAVEKSGKTQVLGVLGILSIHFIYKVSINNKPNFQLRPVMGVSM